MTFEQTLNKHFPGTLLEKIYMAQIYQQLMPHGFTDDNTIACVGLCRDELTHPFVLDVSDWWGEAFNFSSLAGMLFLGKTGFSAAHHHAPHEDGRERYVYFAMPHIAIGKQGEVGVCYREGRRTASGACGALMAFRQELLNGDVNLDLDPDDIEQSLLKQRLYPKLNAESPPDLITLTKITYETILADLERMISLTVDTSHSDYAVLTGIQIHGTTAHYVWPGEFYAMVKGQRHDLSLK